MKRIAVMFFTVASALIINATPVLSGEWGTSDKGDTVKMQKDECLLVASYCPDNVDSIQDRINKLQAEINKGTAVYTDEELRILNDKLTDEYRNYRTLTENH